MKKRMLVWTMALLAAFCPVKNAPAEGGFIQIQAEREYIRVASEQDTDLAEGYIHKMLYPVRDTRLRVKRPAGAGLTGADQALYTLLTAEISAVAAGEVTSTIFAFPAENIYPEYRFTADELGVDTLLTDEGELAEDVRSIMNSLRRSIRISQVLLCLLADSPYELYWFDKSEETGGLYTTWPGIECDGDTVFLAGNLIIEMIVAGEYAADPSGESFEVDPKYGTGVASASANARAIVDAHENDTDYDRLLAYKDEICARTSYNRAAADGEAAYGNPWQLIWVFDDDEETNVVCEGYAKAFQYLNDLSGTADVSVISVTGILNGERHMWNVVNMDNGKNYMADITNCDTATAGYPDRLFLAGYTDGSAADGYTFRAGNELLTYIYLNNPHAAADLEIWNKSYLESLALKPDTPVYTLSSETGYRGYRCAVIMDEPYDSVHILETGETVVPDSGGRFFISSRAAGEEDLAFTISAEREGFVSPYGETVTLKTEDAPEETDLLFPESLTAIGEEAFRGTGVSCVIIPDRIKSIGAYAFADNPSLVYANLNGLRTDPNAFDNCPQAVICICEDEASAYVESGNRFLVR